MRFVGFLDFLFIVYKLENMFFVVFVESFPIIPHRNLEKVVEVLAKSISVVIELLGLLRNHLYLN